MLGSVPNAAHGMSDAEIARRRSGIDRLNAAYPGTVTEQQRGVVSRPGLVRANGRMPFPAFGGSLRFQVGQRPVTPSPHAQLPVAGSGVPDRFPCLRGGTHGCPGQGRRTRRREVACRPPAVSRSLPPRDCENEQQQRDDCLSLIAGFLRCGFEAVGRSSLARRPKPSIYVG